MQDYQYNELITLLKNLSVQLKEIDNKLNGIKNLNEKLDEVNDNLMGIRQYAKRSALK